MYFCSARRQGAGAVIAVLAGLVEDVPGGVLIQTNVKILACQVQVDLVDHQVDDFHQILIDERREDNDFIDSIQEFGIENTLDFVENLAVCLGVGLLSRRTLETQAAAILQESAPSSRS